MSETTAIRGRTLSPWFIAVKQPPVRVGWYRCRNARDEFESMRYWNGRCWTRNGPRTARVGFGAWTFENEWRGLLVLEATP